MLARHGVVYPAVPAETVERTDERHLLELFVVYEIPVLSPDGTSRDSQAMGD